MRLVWFSLILSLTIGPALAEELLDRIIARVDEYVITATDLEEASYRSLEEVRKNYPEDEWETKSREIRNQVLMRMVDEYVCAAASKELEIRVSDEEIEMRLQAMKENAGITSDQMFQEELAKEGMTINELKDSIRRQTLARKVLQLEVYSKIKVSESEINDYFEEHIAVYRIPAQVHAGILLIEVSDDNPGEWERAGKKAESIYEKIQQGAVFEDMVKEYSDGPSTDQGGDIGFIEKGKSLPEFESVAFELNTGDVSKPFRTQHGWNIVKIIEKKEEYTKPLSEQKDEIKTMLKMLKSRDLEAEFLEKYRAKTFIEIKAQE